MEAIGNKRRLHPYAATTEIDVKPASQRDISRIQSGHTQFVDMCPVAKVSLLVIGYLRLTIEKRGIGANRE